MPVGRGARGCSHMNSKPLVQAVQDAMLAVMAGAAPQTPQIVVPKGGTPAPSPEGEPRATPEVSFGHKGETLRAQSHAGREKEWI